jgi:hypothetical protein
MATIPRLASLTGTHRFARLGAAALQAGANAQSSVAAREIPLAQHDPGCSMGDRGKQVSWLAV